MYRRVKFVTSNVVLLVFVTCGVNAKYKNYDFILESIQYKSILNFLAPVNVFLNHDKTFADYADDEAWLASTCRRDLLVMEEAIKRREMWALMMLDASSKLQSGILQGNLIDLGQYDECLAVHHNSLDNDIRGRHCMYSMTIQEYLTTPINPTLSLSVCLPATCSPEDIISFFNKTISRTEDLKDVKISISSATCSPVDPIVWNLELIVFSITLSSFIIFLFACTIIEVRHRNLATDCYTHPMVNTLATFSLRKSAASILSMEIKEGTLPAINGIRFLSMTYIVLLHEHLIPLVGVILNPRDFMKWVQSWNSLHIFIAPFAVDTFFVLSSFLMTYLFLKQMQKKQSFSLLTHYSHRYFRLTPAVIALLVVTTIIIPKLGSGALWDTSADIFLRSCRSKWWSYFLYLQNFVEKDNMCLAHLWYLAVDMQLFWISPLILYPLYKKPKLGLTILSVFFLASLAIPAYVIGIRKLPVSSYTQAANMTVPKEIFFDIYINTYHRAGAWFVGIFLGYEVAIHNRQLNRRTVIIGWFTAIASFAFCALGTRFFMNPYYDYNAFWETLFSAISRPIWALGICWIIYASIKNCAGPLSSILSCRIFVPLSKLSYCTYLIHTGLQGTRAIALRTPRYFSDYDMWFCFFSTLTISIVVAFLFSLLFESPVMVLDTMLLKRKRESQSGSKNEVELHDEDTKS